MATEAPFADEEYLTRYRRAQTLMERDGLVYTKTELATIGYDQETWWDAGLIDRTPKVRETQ